MVTKAEIQEYIQLLVIKDYYKSLSPGVLATSEQVTAQYREIFEFFGVTPEVGAYLCAYALTGVIVNACAALETGQIDQISGMIASVLVGDVLMCLSPYL